MVSGSILLTISGASGLVIYFGVHPCISFGYPWDMQFNFWYISVAVLVAPGLVIDFRMYFGLSLGGPWARSLISQCISSSILGNPGLGEWFQNAFR